MRFLAAAVLLSLGPVWAQPRTIAVDPARLEFVVSATSTGSLDRQISTAVAQVRKAAGSGRIVRIRAFVSGDAAAPQVTQAIAKRFGKAAPVIGVVEVGGFSVPGAQVLLDAATEAKTQRNPDGLVFISGQLTQAPIDAAHPEAPIEPLAQRSIASIKTILTSYQLEPSDVLRLACFASSLADHAAVEGAVTSAFPNARLALMQVEKAAPQHLIECESVARLRTKPSEPVRVVNPANAAFAQAVMIAAPKFLWTTTESGSGEPEDALRQAFARVKASLDQAGSSMSQVVYVSAYPQGAAVLAKYRDVRWEFLDRTHAPASTNLSFAGVAIPGARVGLDVIALPRP